MQFLSFAALAGYDEMAKEEAKQEIAGPYVEIDIDQVIRTGDAEPGG